MAPQYAGRPPAALSHLPKTNLRKSLTSAISFTRSFSSLSVTASPPAAAAPISRSNGPRQASAPRVHFWPAAAAAAGAATPAVAAASAAAAAAAASASAAAAPLAAGLGDPPPPSSWPPWPRPPLAAAAPSRRRAAARGAGPSPGPGRAPPAAARGPAVREGDRDGRESRWALPPPSFIICFSLVSARRVAVFGRT